MKFYFSFDSSFLSAYYMLGSANTVINKTNMIFKNIFNDRVKQKINYSAAFLRRREKKIRKGFGEVQNITERLNMFINCVPWQQSKRYFKTKDKHLLKANCQ